MATNYPLVRLRSEVNGKEYYCRTFDHSTMAVATGPAIVSTNFKVPFDVPHGNADLVVIANGIASEPVDVTVGPWIIHFPINEGLVNRLIGSLADGPLWVLGPNGPIPVDPMSGETAKEATRAWNEIRTGVRSLVELGDKVNARQLKETPAKVKLVPKPTRAHRMNDAHTKRAPKKKRE